MKKVLLKIYRTIFIFTSAVIIFAINVKLKLKASKCTNVSFKHHNKKAHQVSAAITAEIKKKLDQEIEANYYRRARGGAILKAKVEKGWVF